METVLFDGKVLTETMTDMEKLERLFTEGVVAAGKATQNPEKADRTFQKGFYAEGTAGVETETREDDGIKMSIVDNVQLDSGEYIDKAVLLDTDFLCNQRENKESRTDSSGLYPEGRPVVTFRLW